MGTVGAFGPNGSWLWGKVKDLRRRLGGSVAAVFVVNLLVAVPPVQAQDLGAKAQRVRDLTQAKGHERYLVPAPGSRSTVISVDVSTGLFFFLERGSMRGDVVQDFYDAIEAGDVAAASKLFTANANMSVRATDYGWNGLGVPWIADGGTVVNDMLFKDIGGTFRRADEITAEDLARYEEMLDAVLAALESR